MKERRIQRTIPMFVDLAKSVGIVADKELNDTLYHKVVSGDKVAIDKMISANMALVTFKVQSYLLHFPQYEYLRDDLQSQGFVALVEAVNKMVGSDVEQPNPTGFLSQHIHYALGELMDRETTIRVPKRTFLENKAAGKTIHRPEREGTVDFDVIRQQEAMIDPRDVVDLWDELDGCCENDWERSILRLREQGFSDADISQKLGIPKTTTYMMRRGIYERFLHRNPEYRGEA